MDNTNTKDNENTDDGPPEGWSVDWCHVAHEMQTRNAELLFMIDQKDEELAELTNIINGSSHFSSSSPLQTNTTATNNNTKTPTDIVIDEAKEAKITQLAKKVK